MISSFYDKANHLIHEDNLSEMMKCHPILTKIDPVFIVRVTYQEEGYYFHTDIFSSGDCEQSNCSRRRTEVHPIKIMYYLCGILL